MLHVYEKYLLNNESQLCKEKKPLYSGMVLFSLNGKQKPVIFQKGIKYQFPIS